MSEFRTEDVERGQVLVSAIGDNKWELGDLANQVCPATNGDKEGRLAKFAAEIDIDAGTLRNYRAVAAAWEPASRSASSWSAHVLLAGREDRFDIMELQDYWTVDALRAFLDLRPTRYPPPPRPLPPIEPIEPTDLPPLRPPMPLPWDALVEGGRLVERLASLRIEMESWFDRSEERDDRRAILGRLRAPLDDWQKTFDRRTTEVMEASTWS